MEMNTRERILAALRREEPDRVPISTYELVGFNSKCAWNNEPSYARLMDVIRGKTDCIAMWDPGSNETFLASSAPIEMEEESDREGKITTWRRRIHTPRGDLSQTTRVTDGIRTVWQTEHWCKSPEDVDRALSIPYRPVDFDASDFKRISDEVGDRGIIMASVMDPLCLAADMMSFGDYTVWAMTETDHFIRTLDALNERLMENLRRMLEVNVVDLYRICGAEYATPPYLAPALFERFVVGYTKEMTDLIREKGGMVRLHCHGKIGKVLDMIAATGPDAIDPCEAPPDGDITLERVKERVGDRMCIFGNLQLKLLEHGSLQEVEDEVRRCMEAAKANGGYVIMPTSAPINIPLSDKTERNCIHFIEKALEFGRY
jgi:uroporphyrinogen-III decarboxylase